MGISCRRSWPGFAPELYQLYVAAQARGSGVAAALMTDAEAQLAESGVEAAWLACAVETSGRRGSTRSAGGAGAGTVGHQPDASNGSPPIAVWRYEKRLGPPAS